jgi:hypothetical protein
MNTKTILSLSSLGATLMVSLLTSTSAFADEPPLAPTPAVSVGAPSSASAAQPDHALDAPIKPAFKSFALEANPLASAIGRYSVQAEWLPAMHHALVLNPHIDHTSYDIGVAQNVSISENLTGFGAELGYRFYTGEKGANGFYVGPSLLVAHYSASASGFPGTSFSSVGAAVDAGGQFIIGPGVVVGFGFGLQYTSVSGDADTSGLPLAAAVFAGGGVRPRTLLTVGYAF